MEQTDQKFRCSGNCLSCSPAQRAYCASQHAYSNMKVLDKMMEVVINMQDDIRILSEKIEAMQNNEATIFDPNASNHSEPTETKATGGIQAPPAKSPLIH